MDQPIWRPVRRSVQLLGQLHAANALVVALHGGSLLALALGRRLFVELTGAQVGQQAQLFDGALEAAQCHVEGFVLFYTDGGHSVMFPIGAASGLRGRSGPAAIHSGFPVSN